MLKKAIAVRELLVWAYRDQKVLGYSSSGLWEGEAAAANVERAGWSEMWSEWDSLAALGTQVDVSGPSNFDVNEDAEVVHGVVISLKPKQRALVFKYGRAGTEPEWKPFARHRYEPFDWKVKKGKRQGAVSYDAPGAEGKTEWVPIIELDRPDDVDAARKVYSAWRTALKICRDLLRCRSERLQHFELTTELPQDKPWADDKRMQEEFILRRAEISA